MDIKDNIGMSLETVTTSIGAGALGFMIKYARGKRYTPRQMLFNFLSLIALAVYIMPYLKETYGFSDVTNNVIILLAMMFLEQMFESLEIYVTNKIDKINKK